MFSVEELLDELEETGLPQFDVGLKAPFPYFGGKSAVAGVIWQALGDVKRYIEPFFGSGAVLLKRPPTKHKWIYETVNDKDCFVANAWRAIKFAPDEVAEYANWPVNHADMNARRNALAEAKNDLLAKCASDVDYFDAKLAGYWIWLASVWIGHGIVPNKPKEMCPIPMLAHGRGVQTMCKIPHLTDNRGVQIMRKRPQLTSRHGVPGINYSMDDASSFDLWGENCALASDYLRRWMRALADRLRNVQVVCGDWSQVCGGNWQTDSGLCGIFFDPPYASDRHDKLYHEDSLTVAKEVEQWCLRRGNDNDLRIVVAGYDDEYQELVKAGWRVYRWKANGGYANRAKKDQSRGKINRHRECLFLNKNCNDIELF